MAARLPLTRSQLQVWLAHRAHATPSVLNVPVVLDVPARLDVRALVKAFQQLVDESDALRMVVTTDDDGTPSAVVLDRVDAAVDVVATTGDVDGFLDRFVRDRVARPFELANRLFDAAVLTTPGERTICYLNQHHLVTDGSSIGLATQRLGALYAQVVGGISFPEPRSRFAEYVRFAEAFEHSEEWREAERFWSNRLSRPVPWPALYHRIPQPNARAQRLTRTLGRGRSHALTAYAERWRDADTSTERATLAVLLAALASYEWRVSGATTLAIGVPYHNRPPAFRDTLGLFATVVPIVVQVNGDEPAAVLIRRMLAELEGAFAHAGYPLAHSLTAPIYHSLLNYRLHPDVRIGGVTACQRLVFAGYLDGAIAVNVQPDGSGDFVLEFDVAEDVFDPARASRGIEHYLAMLDGILEDESMPIGEIDVLTEAERVTLRTASGAGRTAAQRPSVVEVIARHAIERPDAVAIVDGCRSLTYATFVEDAQRVAGALLARGIGGTDVAVGVAIERSSAALVTILGVLTAGAGYVPLDPAWPDERLRIVAADAHLAGIVTSRTLMQRLSALAPSLPVLAVEELRTSGCTRRPATRRPDDLAYIIYTSGSTGRPKGVEITDRSMAHHAAACVHLFGLRADDRVLQFRSLAFDGSIEEIFPTFAAGAALVLRPNDIGVDLQEFTSTIADRQITVVEIPTSYWHEWVRALVREGRRVPRSVRVLAVGGEQPSASVYEQWLGCLDHDVRFFNMYGPTETAVTAAVFEGDRRAIDPIPMGRPIDHARTYVLDERRRPAPLGVPGELFIGGAGVARGYVNQPELTAQRFVGDPFGAPGDRMYRTGDLVRYTDDGLLEYLGRLDDQVKVRGYRIELTELELALARHPAVEQCVAAASDGPDGSTRLVAYVVAADGVSDAEVRQFLRRSLPEYMVPQLIVRLERLPLTPGGKVDRTALPAPPATPPGEHDRAAPADEIEADIIAIWERELGVKGIGPADSFVDLGGHSLLAARIVHEVGRTFARRVPLSIMFPDVTVAALAAAIRDGVVERQGEPLWTSHMDGRRPPIVFFHGQYGGGGLYAARLERLLPPDQPFVVVHPHGLDGSFVPPTIEEMARERVAHVIGVARPGPVIVGGYCNGALVAIETARLLRQRGYDVRRVVLIDPTLSALPFLPLARAVSQYARWRQLEALEERDTFLRWRDRQLTLMQLIGVGDGRRFGSVGDRVRFAAAAVARKLRGVPAEAGRYVAPPRGASEQEVLWHHFDRATLAYAPAPLAGRVTLIVADEAGAAETVSLWRRVAPQLDVVRLEGDHRTLVDDHLQEIASMLVEAHEHGR